MHVAFTVCTASYLGDAKALRDSVLLYQPGYEFRIFLIDKAIDPSFLEDRTVVDIKTIGLGHELDDMYTRYNYLELCCALKPFAGYHLLQSYDSIIYFDTDVLVLSSLEPIENELLDNDILLTPHTYKDEYIAHERVLVKSGLANGGFFAVRQTDNGKSFLHWWKSKTFDQGYFNLFRDMYSDQLWLTFVPFYFNKVGIVRHPGTNVAIWNIKYRVISKKGDQFYINGTYPLIFFHFSGFKLDVKKSTYKYPLDNPRPDTKALLDMYYDLLKKNKSDSLLVQFDKKNKKVSKGAFHFWKVRMMGKLQVIMRSLSAYLEDKKNK